MTASFETVIGVGGSSPEAELARLGDMTKGVEDIPVDEIRARIERARSLLIRDGFSALYLHAGSNLYYFTGTRWQPSERMAGAILPRHGPVRYIAPAFERSTFKEYMRIEGEISCWQEHESPYTLFAGLLKEVGAAGGRLCIDESAPFFVVEGMRRANAARDYHSAGPLTQACRMIKSKAEIDLLQRAKTMTLEVHKAAARILRPGISTTEVASIIDVAHRRVGAPAGSHFCIVLFGEATAYPHGVRDPQQLAANDMVLIDTGCQLYGYNSDITRSYVFGEPSERQRQVWDAEKQAQASAFAAALPGRPCSAVDRAARETLESLGFGPGYALPGLPHRTGHGIGLDLHEGPYLVMSDHTPLEAGMCFSNEPMICIPGEFGVRHEDHFYMTENGPAWFTQPPHSIDDPFGYRTADRPSRR